MPLGLQHDAGLSAAAADGELWNLRVTSVPEPDDTRGYIERALHGLRRRPPAAVRRARRGSGRSSASTSYHDIVPAVERLEIGYTWYAQSRQRSHVNTSASCCCWRTPSRRSARSSVGWRTDNFNYASQRAIERLGAKLDGVLRHHALRRDGTVRDTVMYSITAGEWPEVKAQLQARLARRATERATGTRRTRR